MKKTVDVIFKDMPEKKLMTSREQEQYYVYLGTDYGTKVSKALACGIFLGSKDRVTCEIDVDRGVPRSKSAIEAMEAHPGEFVVFVDKSGFFLMERTIAMEMAGQLDDV